VRFGQRDRPIQQLLVEIVGDHPLAELHQRPLRKRRVSAAHTVQHQLPPLIDFRGRHRLGIAGLGIGLQQRHHGQQRRRKRRRAAGLVGGCQLGLKGRIEQLMTNGAQEQVELAGAAEPVPERLLRRTPGNRRRPADLSRHGPSDHRMIAASIPRIRTYVTSSLAG